MRPQAGSMGISPTPKRIVKTEGLNFHEAIDAIMDGGKVTKLEWGNQNIYGLLKDGFLTLHKNDNRYDWWAVNDGDILGDDYMVLNG